MNRRRGCLVTLVVLAVLAALAIPVLLARWPWPISDPVRLKAIEAEAQALMATHPARPPAHYARVPESQLPPVIASLHPEWVTVHEWGVDIVIKPYFDGGWGYHVARSRRDLPMFDGCYSEVGHGVFWHGPC